VRKWRHTYCETYRQNFYFIKCEPQQYVRLVKRTFDVDIDAPTGGGRFQVFYLDSIPIATIWIKEWHHLPHEVFHAVYWALSYRGLWLSDGSEEAYAYMIEYLDGRFRQ